MKTHMYKQVLLVIIALTVCSCAPKASIIVDKSLRSKIALPASFYINVTGKTIYSGENSDDVIEVGKIFNEHANQELKSKNLLAYKNDGKNHYVIWIDIRNYQPGNAAGRWLAGIFTTQFNSFLHIDSYLCKAIETDDDVQIGDRIALIPTGDAVTGGILGGIGGWKSVITNSAEAVVLAVEKTFLK